MHDPRSHRVFLLCLLSAACCLALFVGATPPGDPPPDEPSPDGPAPLEHDVSWTEIETLLDEQKFREALERARALEAATRAADEPEAETVRDWTRATLLAAQLQAALGAVETSIEELLAQIEDPVSGPGAERSRLVLDLYAAQGLTTYIDHYSWQIRQRERTVEADGVPNPGDLGRWTLEQLRAAAEARLLDAWAEREAWDDQALGDLAAYFSEGTYPARIRGTLRDTATYLVVDFWANSSYWPARIDDETGRLDLDELLAPGRLADDGYVDDPEAHPLRKIAAALGDLEAWHLEADRSEAAFEAYRQRAEALARHRRSADDRRAILAALTERLDALPRDLPWWSMGQVTVAELVRGGDAPDRLIEARALALEAERAHPESVGARHARRLVAQIEAPAYSLQSMQGDSLGERSLLVRHKNVERLFLRAYSVDLVEHARSSRDYWLLPAHQDVEAIVRDREPVTSWRVDLPETADFMQHRTFVTPPLERAGLYVIVASAREDFRIETNHLSAVRLVLGDLVLTSRTLDDQLEVTARSGETGAPIEGAELQIFRFDWQKGHRPIATRTTGRDGTATAAMPDRSMPYFVIGRHGEDAAIVRSHHATHSSSTTTENVLIYTDRPVYRPGQTVHWKIVAYRGEGLDDVPTYATRADHPVTVQLRDANGEEVEKVAVTTNDFGSASGSMIVPAGRLLGSWSLGTSDGGGASIRVEEYKRPTFEVTLLEPEDALRLDRRATISGEARYYFGLPVSEGEVSWRVVREPVYPSWWGWWRGPTADARTVASGEARLDADGRFELSFLPETPADGGASDSEGVTYRFRVEADVVAAGGETRSDSRAFRLGRVAVDARIELEREFLTTEQLPRATIVRRDLDGTPRAGVGTWTLLRIDQPATTTLPAELPVDAVQSVDDRFATPGDALRARWETSYSVDALLRRWGDGEEIARGRLEHRLDGETADGEATLDALSRPLAPGAYRLRYRTDDAFGQTFTVDQPFLVVGGDTFGSSLPLVLEAQDPTVEVGETARLLAASGFDDQPIEIEMFRNGRRIRHWDAPLDGPILEIPVDASLRGGFTLAVSMLRDHQWIRRTQDVFVPWSDRELEIDVSTFRDRLRPGETERFTITVRDPSGEPLGAQAAEVLALMYDRSLDVFASYDPPSLQSLYPRHTGAPAPTVGLGHTGAIWQAGRGWAKIPGAPALHATRLDVLSGLGIGGPGSRVRSSSPMLMRSARSPAPEMAEEMAVEAEATTSGLMVSNSDRALGGHAKMADDAIGFSVAESADAAPPPPSSGDPARLRTDFSETAFFEPHLATGDDGSVSFTFTVPDAVTDWNVWAHAVTRDLRGGSVQRGTRTVQELMVRPALPRFLRAGDRAELRVQVDNAGETPLEGTLRFTLEDPETGVDRSADFGHDPDATQTFTVEPGRGTVLVVPVVAPLSVSAGDGTVAVRVGAVADATSPDGTTQRLSDGELRPLPILPSRLHLAQSRFAALSERDRRVLTFDDLLADDDPTRTTEQLVVTLDAQLFVQVLEALPYLVDYPYECSEQTLNRFVSTSIVDDVFGDHPAVAAMAETLAARETRTPAWSADDPNRRMQLVESPWLATSRGGDAEHLIPILDPEVASAQRAQSLAQLEQMQTSLGAFPWFPGGPPSPYMTLYILHGLSKVLEHGGDVPRPMVQRAWGYLHRHYVDELAREAVSNGCCWETITFLHYVLSAYPDDTWTGGVFSADDRREMLDHSWTHWKVLPPLLKAQLALTLHRFEGADRADDAMLVFDSLMDSARTDEDLGTYWAPEERAWLWYNDTIEGHAFALRALMELRPDDPRRHGLVQWLFLEKQLNHWKSTRATAEVIWALVHYLEAEGQLGVTERATVTLAPDTADARTESFVFEPDVYTGKDVQVVVDGAEVTPAMGRIEVAKQSDPTIFASATWHFATDRLPTEAEGDLFRVTRRFFRRVLDGEEWTLRPLADGERLEPGDQLEVQLTITARHAAEYVHLRDPRPAGAEPERLASGYRWDQGLGFYEEIRDSGTNFFFGWLPAGEYTLRHRLRATVPGTFRTGPATLQSLYAPEFAAYSTGTMIEISGDAPNE